ncbi:MAG: aspartate kinase [Sediminibacterium sp.]|jgi:aspartate kinase|uniref:aspartate kinase n=1 Tax=Sediminibacterium sp. TaxID=1917865 RepID=UPI001B743FE7|nr:aspartate kinase [Sediminibacterium sp.]MBP7345599.1 aspartate kinase [Sediminibacterium sp.]MDO8995583.1 aspartate kinase [Sediminibacterium sp.]
MKIFKFGGASVNSVERIKNLKNIVQDFGNEPLVIIVSAMGKTTNGLEKVVNAFYKGNKAEALELFNIVKNQHLTTAKYLLVFKYNECVSQLNDFFTEVEWLLHDKPVRSYDYYYDQIVCIGELFSTCIISHFLNEEKLSNQWLDVRDLLRTDNNFRDAGVQFDFSADRIKQSINNYEGNITITQGFIGATDDNESTTLGREGSDYTAAIFANILDAESLTIWKDVEGVMNADPKAFSDAQLIHELNFNEVIEMAYYGAQVIHPKTIKPLQNKSIPLLVKCFLDPQLKGTIIHNKQVKNLPPIIVVKANQVMMHLKTKDFSFIGEAPMSQLYEIFGLLKVKPNLIQTGAISLQLCLDDHEEKINQLANECSVLFDVQLEKQLNLLTIRHYNFEIMNEMVSSKDLLLEQKTKETLQCVYRTT